MASTTSSGHGVLRQPAVGRIGCHADSHQLSALFGDDIAYRADSYAVDMAGWAFL